MNTTAIFLRLKKELKLRGKTYSDIAEPLMLTTSGVKKLFTSHDISLKRLETICQLVGLTVSEVINEASEDFVKDFSFSQEQELLLIQNPELFHLYWKMRVESMPLHEYKKTYLDKNKKSKSAIDHSLKKLEKVGLVVISKWGDIRFSDNGLTRWQSQSALVQILNRKWSQDLIESVLSRNSKHDFYNLSRLKLSEETYAQLKNELLNLADRYSIMATKESNLKSKKSKNEIALMLVAAEYQFVK